MPTPPANQTTTQAHTYPADKFAIKKSQISAGSLAVIRQLVSAKFQAYLVGGAVRDLILGIEPKDFDVATNATPEQVKQLFRRSRIIGKRFRIVHVYQGREIVEVTTFRGHHKQANNKYSNEDGILLRDNVYGSLEEDAFRRDFSINALYYELQTHSIHDFTGALDALDKREISIIGDATTRYTEDPVRMLRAVRFASKLDFKLETSTQAAIAQCAPLLQQVPAARRFDCALKLFCKGYGEKTFQALAAQQLLPYLFYFSDAMISDNQAYSLISKALHNSDARVRQGKSISSTFIFAAMLWPALLHHLGQNTLQDISQEAMQEACKTLFRHQLALLHFPKRIQGQIQDIWFLQLSLERHCQERRAHKIISNPAFRAAFDFLLIRSEANLANKEAASWWQEFVKNTPEAQSRPKFSAHNNHAEGEPKRRIYKRPVAR